jgi:hypothetical protein
MSAPFSLLGIAWLPVRRVDGSRDFIRPAEMPNPM